MSFSHKLTTFRTVGQCSVVLRIRLQNQKARQIFGKPPESALQGNIRFLSPGINLAPRRSSPSYVLACLHFLHVFLLLLDSCLPSSLCFLHFAPPLSNPSLLPSTPVLFRPFQAILEINSLGGLDKLAGPSSGSKPQSLARMHLDPALDKQLSAAVRSAKAKLGTAHEQGLFKRLGDSFCARPRSNGRAQNANMLISGQALAYSSASPAYVAAHGATKNKSLHRFFIVDSRTLDLAKPFGQTSLYQTNVRARCSWFQDAFLVFTPIISIFFAAWLWARGTTWRPWPSSAARMW
jgi:hypothetical protein